ncbi:MAG: hypothetical protein ABH952_07260 [Candidatus Omnitrophota bacterium]
MSVRLLFTVYRLPKLRTEDSNSKEMRIKILGLILLLLAPVFNGYAQAEEDTSAPFINISTPDANDITRSNIVYGGVSRDVVKVEVNGTAAEIINQGEYRAMYLGRPKLNKGITTITATATNAAGNSSTKSVEIDYQPDMDKVEITSPKDNAIINVSPIEVSGRVGDGMKDVSISGGYGRYVKDNTFRIEIVHLNWVKTVLTVDVSDEEDNEYKDSIVVNSPELKFYEIFPVSEGSCLGVPVAGDIYQVTVRLKINFNPAGAGERIVFRTIEGAGSFPQEEYITNNYGEVTVPFTTDKDASVRNRFIAEAKDAPQANYTFEIYTVHGRPANMEQIKFGVFSKVVAGEAIDIEVKVTDKNNNPIRDKEVSFLVEQGGGRIVDSSTKTNYFGGAHTTYITEDIPGKTARIKAYCSNNPSINTVFTIETVSTNMTVEGIMDEVNKNYEKIEDFTADIEVTTDASWHDPYNKFKIWIKGNKKKVEQIYPEPKEWIPPLLPDIFPETFTKGSIISFAPENSIYVVQPNVSEQERKESYYLDYVDCKRGVIIKTEYYSRKKFPRSVIVTEYLDFIKINGIWRHQKEIVKDYDCGNLRYTMTKILGNIQINTGISDDIFNE